MSDVSLRQQAPLAAAAAEAAPAHEHRRRIEKQRSFMESTSLKAAIEKTQPTARGAGSADSSGSTSTTSSSTSSTISSLKNRFEHGVLGGAASDPVRSVSDAAQTDVGASLRAKTMSPRSLMPLVEAKEAFTSDVSDVRHDDARRPK
jgi:hypothetical protein